MTRTRPAMAVGIIAILLVGLLGLGSFGPARAASTWTPTQGAFFNKPRTSVAFAPEKHVVSAIRHAGSNSYIRMAMFSFDRGPVADALIDAHRNRHVHVQVIVNGHEWTPAQRRLQRVLGGNPSASSFLYHCKDGSCRGTGDSQHSKFITFTRTAAATDTVMLGSLNMKANGYKNQYNNIWIKNGVHDLHDYLVTVFDQMRQDRVFHHAYLKQGFGKNLYLYVFPFRGTDAEDPVAVGLRNVTCRGARTNSGRSIVRVNMHAWDGDRGVQIAKKLRSMYADGCDVKVQYGMAGKRVREVFAQKTKRGFVPVRSNGFDTDGDGVIDLYSHQKVLTVNGHFGTQHDAKVVWTGSSNYEDSGKWGDEILFRIKSPTNYARFAANWKWMWDHKTRSVPWRSAGRVTTSGSTLDVATLLDPLSDRSLRALRNAG